MSENRSKFVTFWNGLSDWLHAADLVPVVIVVSTYHYYGALKSHDPIWVAFPIALFVDLLHYRSVSRAVKSGGAWWLAALITSSMAFGLQFYFYATGQNVGAWAWLYASLVPVGLGIMAMLTHAQAAEKIRDWVKELAEMAAALAKAQEEARIATAEAQAAAALKQEANEEKQRATLAQQEANEEKQRATLAQQEANEEKQRATEALQGALQMKREAAEALGKAQVMQQEAEAGKRALGYWPHLNDKTAAGLRYLAGEFDNMETAAEAANCHKSTLSKHIAKLNHNGQE